MWTGRVSSESDGDGRSHAVSIEWEEGEELQAAGVSFEGLELKPVSYEQEADSDSVISITLQARLSAAQTKRLRAIEIADLRSAALLARRSIWYQRPAE